MASPHLPADYNAPELNPEHLAEWVNGSGIDPHLARLNLTSFTGDAVLELLIGNRLAAAGGHAQQYATGEIAPILNSCECLKEGGWWCSGVDLQNGCNTPMAWGLFKPDHPRTGAKGREIKYEHPHGEVERLLALLVPEQPDYWAQIKADPDIAIVLDEGAKKAAAWLTAGIPAICLPGIWAGTPPVDKADPEPRKGFGYGSKTTTKTKAFKAKERKLHPDLVEFAKGRTFFISLDYETDADNISRRDHCTRLLTEQLYANGAAKVLVCHREGPEKGSDDLLLTSGPEALHDLLKTAELANLPPIMPAYRRQQSTLLNGEQDTVDQVAEAINQKLLQGADWAVDNNRAITDAFVMLQLANIPGMGKSHLVPQLAPRLLSLANIECVVYVSSTYRSPSISALQSWAAPPSRHNGLVVDTIQGQPRLRRRKATDPDEAVVEQANCRYSCSLQRLRSNGASQASASQFCKDQCPERSNCKYVRDRHEFQHGVITGETRLIRCSTESLPMLANLLGTNPSGKWKNTFLIFDEAPQLESAAVKEHSIPLKRLPEWTTWLRTTFPDEMATDEGQQLQTVLDRLATITDHLEPPQIKFGAGLQDILEVTGPVPSLASMPWLLVPELDQLPDTDDARPSDITEPTLLPTLINALSGQNQSDTAFFDPKGKGSITTMSRSLQLTLQVMGAAGSLVLDGTAHLDDINHLLFDDIHKSIAPFPPVAIKTAHALRPATVEFVQIADMGAMGRNRGQDMQRRLEQLLPAIKQHVRDRFGADATTGVLEKSHFRDRDDGHGVWFVDNQGSNAYETDQALIMVGTPAPNLTAALAQFQALYSDRSAHLNAPAFRSWYAQRMGEQLIQGIHRLRPIRREGETLMVFIISDADLSGLCISDDVEFKQIPSSTFCMGAAPKRERTRDKVINAIWSLYREGTPADAITTRRVAEVVGCTHTTARRQADQQSWMEFVQEITHRLSN